MATQFTDSKGVVWDTVYEAPSFGQIHPWQGLAARYAEFPHLFAFTESGLHDDIQAYAATHTPRAATPVSTAPDEPVKALTDARGVHWILVRRVPDPTAVGPWRGYVNTSEYGSPKPDFTAATEALLRAEIASYVVGHPVVKTPPKPAPKPGGAGGSQQPPIPPIVQPAGPAKKAAAPVVALAALFGFGALLLSRRA